MAGTRKANACLAPCKETRLKTSLTFEHTFEPTQLKQLHNPLEGKRV
jgi:hypothetical protein